MDYTYLDYFNYYLKEFLNEIITNYPETQSLIVANYRSLLEGKDNKNDMYVKYFYTKINNSLQLIATKDDSLFTSSCVFLEGVDFTNIWHSSNTTEKTKKSIWKYLQILMIIGRKIIPNHKEIVDILNKISNGEISAPAKVEHTLANTKDDDEKPNSVFGLGDIASSLGNLGGLASGLTSMLGGSGSGDGLGNLISSFSSMLNNPEFTTAMSQLSQQVSEGLSQQSSTTENTTENTTNHSQTENNTENNTEKTTDTQSESSEQPQLFNNPLFGDLAKEIASTFNFEEMNQGQQPANIGDALGKFMSGNNPAKLMNLVGKFGSRLQDEVKSGRLNPMDLLKQTMGATTGNMPESLQRVAEAMANNPQLRRATQQQSTRDRLRSKLDKKRQEKTS